MAAVSIENEKGLFSKYLVIIWSKMTTQQFNPRTNESYDTTIVVPKLYRCDTSNEVEELIMESIRDGIPHSVALTEGMKTKLTFEIAKESVSR